MNRGRKMSIQIVREYFKQYGLEDKIMEFEVSSATVELAAQAVGVEGARICKTLSFKDGEDGCILIQMAGDAKIDNRKFKDFFKQKEISNTTWKFYFNFLNNIAEPDLPNTGYWRALALIECTIVCGKGISLISVYMVLI